MSHTQEIVLPSGRFATVRPMTWIDRVLTRDDNAEAWILKMALRVVQIDGEPLRIEQAMEMDLSEANPIIMVVADGLAAALKSKGVS